MTITTILTVPSAMCMVEFKRASCLAVVLRRIIRVDYLLFTFHNNNALTADDYVHPSILCTPTDRPALASYVYALHYMCSTYVGTYVRTRVPLGYVPVPLVRTTGMVPWYTCSTGVPCVPWYHGTRVRTYRDVFYADNAH